MNDAPKKWTVKTEKTVYRNKWITVREYQTIAPTGADALYGVVHYHNHAIGILPIDKDGSTVLVGQERFPFGRYSWELPEGGGALDVAPLEAAKRELSEEAGLKAANWLPLIEDAHRFLHMCGAFAGRMAECGEGEQGEPRFISEAASDAGHLHRDVRQLVRFRHFGDCRIGDNHRATARRQYQRHANHTMPRLGIDTTAHIFERYREIAGHTCHHGVGVAERHHA